MTIKIFKLPPQKRNFIYLFYDLNIYKIILHELKECFYCGAQRELILSLRMHLNKRQDYVGLKKSMRFIRVFKLGVRYVFSLLRTSIQ